MKITAPGILFAATLLAGCATGLKPVDTPEEFTPPPSHAAQWEALDAVREDDWFHLLNTGGDALEWRLRAIDSAVDSIDLQTFIWDLDGSGELIRQRLLAAVGFLANAQTAFDLTLDWVNERKAFGKPIAAFQNSRFKMAEMRTALDVTQTFVDQCVLLHNAGKLSAELAAEAKLKASELESHVMDECVQLHGGAGYMSEYRISHMFTDARVSRIYAGSSEIMKEIIARGIGLDERKLCG